MTPPLLIDAHAHIAFNAFKNDAAEVIARAEDEDIWMLAVGSQIDTSRRAVEYAERNPHIWAVVGLHPIHLADTHVDLEEVGEEGNEGIAFRTRRETFDPVAYRALAEHPKTVGIGECGMDFYRMPSSPTVLPPPFAFSPQSCDGAKHEKAKGPEATAAQVRSMQEQTFRQHIALAQEVDLPLMIHVRDEPPTTSPAFADASAGRRSPSPREGEETIVPTLPSGREVEWGVESAHAHMETNGISAHEETLRILADAYGPWSDEQPRGMIHCYSGTWEQAQRYLALGFNISFTGVITFTPTKKQLPMMEELRRTVREVPLDRFHVETDCPYLTPEPHRGERNEPRYVRHVAEKVAAFRGVSFDAVARASVENTLRLFRRMTAQ